MYLRVHLFGAVYVYESMSFVPLKFCPSHAMSLSLSPSLTIFLPSFLPPQLSHASFRPLTSFPFYCLLVLLRHMHACLYIALFISMKCVCGLFYFVCF